MSERWPGGLISPTAPNPPNSYNTTKANGVWTLDQAAYLTSKNHWPNPNSDQYFNYNTLLLNGDGTNGAQNNTFLDSSTNNFTITRNGNTTQGSFSPYGNLWSNYFTTSNYLTASGNAAFQLGSGDFTIEAWIFPTANAGSNGSEIISYGASGQFDGWHFYQVASTNVLSFGLNYAGLIVSSSAALTLNQWTYVAVTRSGTTFKLWINGVNDGTATSSTSQSTNGSDLLYVGTGSYSQGADRSFNGYISNARVIKGTAIYTSNFTPSTTPLTAVSGTSLLSCQSNRFIDNSSNAFALTVNGTPSVQRFSPFNPTAPYSTSVIGGSAYNAASGDYLATPQNSTFNLSTGDWTIEGWFYSQDYLSGGARYITVTPASGSTFGVIPAASGNSFALNQFGVANILSTSIPSVLNSWQHIALVNNGGTTTLYVNGVSGGTILTSLWAPNSNTQIMFGGNYLTYAYNFTGYYSNCRVVMGTAVYTSTFTPPTAPVTAITNTALLCNYTNAGIPDLAMQNNLETVGNAQVSTSVKKYGTGSLSFDGSGDWLFIPNTPNLQLGSGNFTIEGWINFSSLASNRGIMYFGTNPNSNFSYGLQWAGNALYFWYTTTGSNLASVSASWTPSTSVWYFLAVTRSGNDLKFFIDGTQIGTTQSLSGVTIFNSTDVILIGGEATGSPNSLPGTMNGYIDDFRVTKGLARYTTTFTPPTAALPTY